MPKNYYASDVLSTTSNSSSTTSTITQFSEGTITGAIIGTVGGVMYGKFSNKNFYFTGFIGMVIGGVISKIITM